MEGALKHLHAVDWTSIFAHVEIPKDDIDIDILVFYGHEFLHWCPERWHMLYFSKLQTTKI